MSSSKFKPTIFVGLGGSGGAVVNAIAQKLHNHPDWKKLEPLVHFMIIDTNQDDLEKATSVPRAHRFPIAAFDRPGYVKMKTGKSHSDADPKVTQWIHQDYAFRETLGAGAGQIRVESRLGLHYNLESDRIGIRRALERMISAATSHDIAVRNQDDKVINFSMYCSVAGGTGSGAFIPVAYFLKRLVQEKAWGRPNIVGHLMLPSLFEGPVERALVGDIQANAYAALKELEHLTRLDYTTSLRPPEETFVFDPDLPGPSKLESRPFTLAYIIDKPSAVSMDRYLSALSDSSYLQIFSPLLGQQDGEYDNYEKHQKSLAAKYFSVHYGTFGSTVLLLPRRDILRYASMRYVARAFERYLSFTDNPAFAVPWEDVTFTNRPKEEQDRIIDEKFLQCIEHEARKEAEQNYRGPNTVMLAQEVPGQGREKETLREVFQRRLSALFEEARNKVELDSIDDAQITEQRPSLFNLVQELVRQLGASSDRVSTFLASIKADLSSDRFLGDFFERYKVDPLSQRIFLIRLVQEERLYPDFESESFTYLFELKSNTADFSSDGVREEVRQLEAALAKVATPGIFTRVTGRENTPFLKAKRNAVQSLEGKVEAGVDYILASFWQRFHDELLLSVEARLSSFRDVARLASSRLDEVVLKAQRFAEDPASNENAQVAQYYLRTEVLRNDVERRRLWSAFFRDRLDKRENYDDQKVFALITSSFAPKQEANNRLRKRDAREILEVIEERLSKLADETFEKVIEGMSDFDLQGMLELEARYVIAGEDASEEALAAVSAIEVERHILEKLGRVIEECALLANIDQSKLAEPGVTPAKIFYVGLSERYDSTEAGSLGKLIERAAVRNTSGISAQPKLLKGDHSWDDGDSIVFYRALLGMPLYFLSRVQGQLYDAYKRLEHDEGRAYPLHIDRNWESLPNLDPMELKLADAKRRRELELEAEAARRAKALRTFTVCTLINAVVEEDGVYKWSLDGRQDNLGTTRPLAFEAMNGLPGGLAEDLHNRSKVYLEKGLQSRQHRVELVEALQRHHRAVHMLYLDAEAEHEDAQARFLEEEKAVISELMEEASPR